jgi:hypothetical protein
MYYLMHKGYEYRGDEDRDPDGRCYPSMKGKTGPVYGNWALDRNRPDWQEAMLRDFAALGMTQTHLNIYPVGGKLELDADLAQAIRDYVALSGKHGLRVGVRLDAPDETVLWSMHPSNPENRRAAYLKWAGEVAALLKGSTLYYILGDELTLVGESATRPTKSWTAAMYLDYFNDVRRAIQSRDPGARVCMFSASSGEWFNVVDLLQHGYAEVGAGVAINHYNWRELDRFLADRDRLAPGKLFLTSGVGYVSNGPVSPRYPEGDGYSKCPDEASHASEIARTMYAWWYSGADNAPYYISLRNWEIEGKTYPRWFGFFGFEDYVVSKDVLSVRRYPGWYAFQAVATTFYDRARHSKPDFAVTPAEPLDRLDAFVHPVPGGSELLMMTWNNRPASTRVTIGSTDFGYPVRVPLEDAAKWQDLEWGVEAGKTWVQVPVGPAPVIVRWFRK